MSEKSDSESRSEEFKALDEASKAQEEECKKFIEKWNAINKRSKVENYLENGSIRWVVFVHLSYIISEYNEFKLGRRRGKGKKATLEVYDIEKLRRKDKARIDKVTFFGNRGAKATLSNTYLIEKYILPLINEMAKEYVLYPEDPTSKDSPLIFPDPSSHPIWWAGLVKRSSLQEFFNETFQDIMLLKEIGFPPKFFYNLFDIDRSTFNTELSRAREVYANR